MFYDAFVPFKEADLKLDIAVVGAGISGAYSAWRLQQHYLGKKIGLFEYSDRIGGRLFSRTLPGMPHVHAELGGMRFIPATQKLVSGLVKHLGLPTRDFPMGSADPKIGDSNNIMYLRRKLLRVRDLTDPSKVPYLLNSTEQGMDPDKLQKYVMVSLFPEAAARHFSQEEWQQATAFDGQPLYKLGFWYLLYKMLSSEAYQFMDDAGGYYTNVANTNAVSSLPVDDYSADVKYAALRDGYDTLPVTLVERFKGMNGQFFINYRLDSFGRRGTDPYALKFIKTQTDEYGRTKDISRGSVVKVHADHVILAMPRRSLELIRWSGFLDDGLKVNIRSVISQWAFKIFLAYPYPWWRALGLEAGRSITDMPIRQTFYFQTEGECEGAEKKNLNSLLMVSYSDLGSVPFWKALEEGDEFEGNANDFLLDQQRVPRNRSMITRQMVDAAQAQVREIHGLKYVPEPYTGIYQDWSCDPLGAGWHGWKAGFKYWEIMKTMRRPLPSENVYICGEAYSNNQGWVEGALETAELVLEEYFDLDRPSEWLDEGHEIGGSTLHATMTNPKAFETLLALRTLGLGQYSQAGALLSRL